MRPTAFFDPDLAATHEAESRGLSAVAAWEAVLDSCDAVCIGTPMHLHAQQAVEALGAGKHVLCEVTAAVTLDECISLKAAARNGPVYFFAENYCHFEQNLIALELVRSGKLGQPYYGEGDYVHEVRFLHRHADGSPTWRMEWQVGRRGNTYCTHELGPLMQWFRAFDPEVRIDSVACFGTGAHTDPSVNHDDCSLTLIQLSNGGLIKLRLDMQSNRPHRIAYTLQGVNGAVEYENEDHRVWLGENKTVSWNELEQRQWGTAAEHRGLLSSELRSEIQAASASGHGGADYLVGRRFAQAVAGMRPTEIGVRDAIEWTVAGLLSQRSILQGGASIPMPAFVYEP